MSDWDIVSTAPMKQQALEYAKRNPPAGENKYEWAALHTRPPGQDQPLDWYRKQIQARTFQGSPDFIGTASEGEIMPTNKQMIAESLPMIGDIALTAAAPELKGASMGIKALNTLMRAGGSGLGSFLGDLGRQKMLGYNQLDLGEAGRQAAMGAIGETGTSAAIGALKSGAKPLLTLAGDFSQVAKGLSRKAAAALQKTQIQTKNLATQRAIDFMESLGATSTEEAGMSVGKALAGKADFAKIYKPWNDAVDKIAERGNGEILMDDTTQYISDMLSKFRDTAKNEDQAVKHFMNWLGFEGDVRSVQTIKQMMRDGYLGPNDAKYVMANFWKKKYGTVTDAANQWKEGLKSAFLGDIDKQSFGAAAAKDVADKTFAAVNQYLRESPASKKIISKMDFGRSDRLYYQDFPERVGDIIFKKQPDEIMKVRNAVVTEPGGEEAWKMLTLNHVTDLIRSAMKREDFTGKLIVRPAELAEKILANENTLKAAMPLGEWKRLAQEAQYFASVAPKFEKIPVDDAFDLFEAWSVLSPKSQKIAKKAIGGALKLGKQASKIGLHEFGSMYNKPIEEARKPNILGKGMFSQ
jgi:flagellin-specific chaperone FliS